jgi:hypothetical protein
MHLSSNDFRGKSALCLKASSCNSNTLKSSVFSILNVVFLFNVFQGKTQEFTGEPLKQILASEKAAPFAFGICSTEE